MSEQLPDVVMYLRTKIDFTHGVPAGWLTSFVTAVDHAAHGAWVEEIRLLQREIKDLPAVVVDASLERLRQWRGRHVRVVAADRGSIVLTAAVLGTAHWILDRTLAEAIADERRVAEIGRRLHRSLVARIDAIVAAIGVGIRRQLKARKITCTIKGTARATSDLPTLQVTARAAEEGPALIPLASLSVPPTEPDPRQLNLFGEAG